MQLTDISEHQQPVRQCNYCYKNTLELKKCSKCHHREFCSIECQTLDWKVSHRQNCCKSGEMNHDFEILLTKDKGYGIFALRNIKKYERVLMERVLFKKENFLKILSPNLQKEEFPLTISELNAFFALSHDELDEHEHQKTLLEALSIFSRNAYGIGSQNSYICIHMAKMNHDCNPNMFMWSNSKDVDILIASSSRDISQGEELTVNYTGEIALKHDRQDTLSDQYKFECKCETCLDPHSDDVLIEIKQMADEISELGLCREDLKCAVKGLERIKEFLKILLQSEFTTDPALYSRMCYDGYLLGCMHESLKGETKEYLELALQHSMKVYGSDHEDTKLYERLLQ
jgi:hypothetical protein